MLTLMHFLVAGLLLILSVYVVWKVVVFISAHVVQPTDIAVAKFSASSQALEAHAASAPNILTAKFAELRREASQKPAGYGFLEYPGLSATLNLAEERQSQIAKQLEAYPLKIKDVDLNAFLQLAKGLLAPPKLELSGHFFGSNEFVDLTCELRFQDSSKADWHTRVRVRDGQLGEAAETALDNVVFQITYDYLYGASRGKGTMPTEGYQPKDWQTLQAYTRGVQALRAYQETLDYADLTKALAFLERLPRLAPNDAQGLFFYGVALGENRDEEEAVEVFRQIQRISSAPEDIKLEAQFQEAAALLRIYSSKYALQAVETLDRLITMLEGKPSNVQLGTPDSDYYTKLLAVSYSQKAYTYGTLLSFFRQGSVDADRHDYYKKVEENLDKARASCSSVGNWKPGEENEVRFRIKNAEGYSKFRYAYFKQPEDDAGYRNECVSALKDLEEADALRPNHYEVLQNMAMIYADERYDPSVRSLEIAERLFERTKKFVPNDYYQYEQLARIQWRRLQKADLPLHAKDLIDKGRQDAEKALKWRPHAGETLLILARFAVRWWKDAPDEATRGSEAQTANLHFEAALKSRPQSVEIMHEYAEFLVAFMEKTGGFGAAVNKAHKSRAKELLTACIEKTEGAKDPRRKELNQNARALLARLA